MSFEGEITEPVGAPLGIIAARVLPSITMIPSPHCNRLTRQRTQFIALHATDGHEDDGKPLDGVNRTAESVAKMFADPDLKPRRCAQYTTDADSVVQSCADLHRAWAAGRHGNDLGIHVELCGRAKQSRAEWYDAVSLAELQLAARLVATLCTRHSIPRQFVPAADLIRGVRGITTHDEIRIAWKETDHRDPGPNFPLLDFIRAVQLAGP